MHPGLGDKGLPRRLGFLLVVHCAVPVVVVTCLSGDAPVEKKKRRLKGAALVSRRGVSVEKFSVRGYAAPLAGAGDFICALHS